MPEEAADTPDWARELFAVGSWEGLRALLVRMRLQAGNPSMRTMADTTIKLKDYSVGKSLVAEVFKGTKQPKRNHLLGIVYALGVSEEDWKPWCEVWARLQEQPDTGRADAGLRIALHAAGEEVAQLRDKLERLTQDLERFRAECHVADDRGQELRELNEQLARDKAMVEAYADDRGRLLRDLEILTLLKIEHVAVIAQLEAKIEELQQADVERVENAAFLLRMFNRSYKELEVTRSNLGVAMRTAKEDRLAARTNGLRVAVLSAENAQLRAQNHQLNEELREALRADRDLARAQRDFAVETAAIDTTGQDAPTAPLERIDQIRQRK